MISARPLVALTALLALSTGLHAEGNRTVQVSGSGVDALNTAIVHRQQPTPTGMIQQSTETVELTGDLKGRVLYHVTSVFDFVHGTLVNTGEMRASKPISGMIMWNRPVVGRSRVRSRRTARLPLGAAR